jgi:outer membrane protein assembly factor BamB
MLAKRLLPFLLVALLSGADWPRFRGPNGTGTSADKDVPVKWGEKNVLFKAKLPGVGRGSPIVVGDRVFLLAATRGERLVVCLDAKTGEEKWVKKVPGKVGRTHPKSSLANSTPCSDGKKVYCVFWDGRNVGLYAYDIDGKLAWEKDLGPFKSQHGPGFSPMLYQDGKTSLVIVNNDQDDSARLLAFDTEKGELKWEKKRKAFRSCYSTPILNKTAKGEAELIVTSTAGITGYAPATGEERWTYRWSFPVKPLRTVGSSVVEGGMVFASSGDGDGSRAMIGVKLGGSGDVTKTNHVWSIDSNTPYVPTVLAKGGYLYTIYDKGGTAICRDAKTGEAKWRRRISEADVSASPVMIDGKVFVIDEDGTVTVFEATAAGYKQLAKNRVGESVLASPAVANGRLYVRGERHLFCIGKPKS